MELTPLKTPPLDFDRIPVTPEFISRNKLTLRTTEEIGIRYNLRDNSAFQFGKEVLINHLSFETAKPHLKAEYVREVEAGTKQWPPSLQLEETVQDFLDYMVFAWGKAIDERGLSAMRSIQKLGVWLWLLNREDLHAKIEDDDLYNPYGAPALISVCKELGIEVPEVLTKFAARKV